MNSLQGCSWSKATKLSDNSWDQPLDQSLNASSLADKLGSDFSSRLVSNKREMCIFLFEISFKFSFQICGHSYCLARAALSSWRVSLVLCTTMQLWMRMRRRRRMRWRMRRTMRRTMKGVLELLECRTPPRLSWRSPRILNWTNRKKREGTSFWGNNGILQPAHRKCRFNSYTDDPIVLLKLWHLWSVVDWWWLPTLFSVSWSLSAKIRKQIPRDKITFSNYV